MRDEKKRKGHIIYASIIHAITILSAILALLVPAAILGFPEANLLHPNKIFGAVFSGADPGEIQKMFSPDSFSGIRLFLRHIGSPDAWAMLVIALGSSAGLWALLPAVICHIKNKEWLETAFALLLALLIAAAMSGIVKT
jgi:hypothetical protein